jgi:hypothetical protein
VPAPEDSDREDRDVRVVVVGAIASGWFLFAIVAPLALFLTWFGDCFRATCPVASDLDRAIYTADLLAWIVLPALIVFAYRGSRAASATAALVGAGIVAQAVASVLGARGFQTFFLVFPAGGLIVIGGLLGALGTEIAARSRRPAGRLGGRAVRPRRRRPSGIPRGPT